MGITTNEKGNLAELKATIRAAELGYEIYRPIFHSRCDLLLNDGSGFLRIQVKYANGVSSTSTGAVVVKLAYETRKRRIFTYQETEVDGLVVYIPKIDKICYFPTEKFVGKQKLQIRIDDPKNKQKKGIIYARDYLW